MPRWFRLVLIGLLFVPAAPLIAHPAGGLVVAKNGDVYFTFIHPMLGPPHHACVWRLNEDGPEPVVISEYSPGDIMLELGQDGRIYGGERRYLGEIDGRDVFESRLWRLEDSGETTLLIPPTRDHTQFQSMAYTVDRDGNVYFEDGPLIRKRTPDGAVSVFAGAADNGQASELQRAEAMVWGPDDFLYVLDKEDLRRIAPDGTITTIARDLKTARPEDLPFAGADILFDLAVDPTGNTYVTYYGLGRVLKVAPDGTVSTVLQASAPWAPHGIAWHEGVLVVLESSILGDLIHPRIRTIRPGAEASTLFILPDGGKTP